jgi:hypothetical protein
MTHISNSLEILSLNPTAQDPDHGFTTATLQVDLGIRIIHAFSGSFLLTSDGVGRLHLWNAENPQMKVELRSSLAEQVR